MFLQTASKRSSLLSGASLSRFLSRSSRSLATQDDSTVKAKKGGLFSIFRREKSSDKDKEAAVVDKSAPLPPPKLLSKFPPQHRRSFSSSEDSGHELKTTEFPSFSRNAQQTSLQRSVDVDSTGFENDEKAGTEKYDGPALSRKVVESQDSDTSSLPPTEDLRGRSLADGRAQVLEREPGMSGHHSPENDEEYVDMSVDPLQDNKTPSLDLPVQNPEDRAQTSKMTFQHASFELREVDDVGEYQDVIALESSTNEQEFRKNSASDEEYEDVTVGPFATNNVNCENENANEDYDDVVVGPLAGSDGNRRNDEEEHDKVAKEVAARVQSSMPASTQVNKTSKWNNEESTDSASSEYKLQDTSENGISTTSKKQQTKVEASEILKSTLDRDRNESDNESDISSYHSSLILSARSSVSLSDEIHSSVDADFQPQEMREKLDDALHGSTGSISHAQSEVYSVAEDLKSDSQPPNGNSAKGAYENFEVINQRKSSSHSPNDSQSAGTYMSLPEDHPSSNPPGSSEFEDGFEDSVYDTIEIVS